jgi:hypothetical protein
MVAGRAVTPREKVNAERLHQYWVAGAGLAKWASSPHPWTALHRQLAKYIYDPHLLDATVSPSGTARSSTSTPAVTPTGSSTEARFAARG